MHKKIWLIVALIAVMVAIAGLAAACGTTEESTTTTAPAGPTTTAAGPTTTAAPVETTTTAAAGPTPGGIFAYALTGGDPAFIDPVNGQEAAGIDVIQCVFDSLMAYDPTTGKLVPAAADSWEPNADASVWTFHLNKNAKFHNGRAVTAADFKYAWERICNPDNASEISYHLAAVKGYQDMQDKKATELTGVKVIDDYTLEVTLSYPFGDFELVVAHPTLAPVPKEEVDKDPKAFADMPIGNGPFKMVGPWQHDQLIQVVRNDDYYGEKALLDGIDYKIFKDEETAWLEFQAGNLDFTRIPTGQLKAAQAQYGVSDDGWTIEPGKQVLTGSWLGTNYAILNMNDQYLKNADLRKALSLAINRQAICDTIYEGARAPATDLLPAGMLGYTAGAWPYAKYDVEQAKQYLEKAGFPGGQGLPEFEVIFNSGSGHEKVYALVQADWAAIGVKSKLVGIEWAQFLDTRDSGKFQIARAGWVADYPSPDNFLWSLLSSASADNDGKYNNPAYDKLIEEARVTTDLNARVAKYQEANKIAAEDCPLIITVNYANRDVGSDRYHGLIYSALQLASMEKVWIEKDKQ
jgi:oligopeptide transport system substrate-binding protein